ncbi:MAG: cytochrome b/b6 domain-containing protein [Candidatus Eisenbacteria bacterium]|uniref:Cytochrome b/b6 domain-containing protein n=1 Tax=Eiseniibacteriota bacterium TaxID=2212470 RepID=A0A948WD46_UNCEI|nr:cytochrome b/b6 domain-containing protein [Candidatus Eisenbacteria bacterium]MBU1950280.1 cytochrome b/b6 domain-containing protein [Candidatus Eisenbacteria bacterium]MBU2691508.1 cytochrome b/b6 domain-containing protein [Candidatus Eisenbacteria bacterium]
MLSQELVRRCLVLLVLICLAVLPAAAQDFTNEDCDACHADTGGDLPEVSHSTLMSSVHADQLCTDCHTGIEELPHSEILPPAECGACHGDVAESYVKHGLGIVGVSTAIPNCIDCHGTHDIKPVADKTSRVNPLRLPQTCGKCHEDEKFTEAQGIRFKHPVKVYSVSVHGRAALGGVYSAASCNDCHSAGGDAHQILSPGDIKSPINHFNITKTCGQCHRYIAQDYSEGIHGQLTERGEVESPICTTCHGEHNILLHDDPRSPVSSHRLAEATCSPCHESAALNEKYSLPTGRLHSFRDSYHGLKSQAGDITVANCASCHGAHRILPASDPTSTVYKGNLVTTCGGCHPSITPEMASTPIHASSTGIQAGAAAVVRAIYVWAIAIIIGAMALHWLIDLIQQIHVTMKKKKQVKRMDADEVVQHFFLALSFTLLVISGFSLRFYDAWWSKLFFGWDGGSAFRGTLHRVCGVVMLMVTLWHMLFLLTARGRRFLRDMAPGFLDVKQFFQMMAYNLGRQGDHPQFGRFSYVEKAEYWALVWGTVVMAISGLFLWFDNLAIHWFPKGFLDVMLVVHYYEAWLAFLAILIWHMYSTVFSPKVYPMNPSWLTGNMPEEQFKAEHPLIKIPEPKKETES